MPSVHDQASYNSNRIQKAYKFNGIEQTKLLRRLQLIERENLHKIRLTNREIKMINLMYENIQVTSGHSPEGIHPDFVEIREEDEVEACFLYGERTTSRRFGKRRKRKQIDMRAKSDAVSESNFDDVTSTRLQRSHSAAGIRHRSGSVTSIDSVMSTGQFARPSSSPAVRSGHSRFRFVTEESSSTNPNSRLATPWKSERSYSTPGIPKTVWADPNNNESPETPRAPDRTKTPLTIDVNDFDNLLSRKTEIKASDYIPNKSRRPSKSAPIARNPKIVDIVNQVRLASSALKKWKLASSRTNALDEADRVIADTRHEKSLQMMDGIRSVNERRSSLVDDKVSEFLYPRSPPRRVRIKELTEQMNNVKVSTLPEEAIK